MRILLLFLIAYIFAVNSNAKSQRFEDSPGLSPPLYTTPQIESSLEKRSNGEIDSFVNETSKDSRSCGSCGA